MYTKELEEIALKEYERLVSITAVIHVFLSVVGVGTCMLEKGPFLGLVVAHDGGKGGPLIPPNHAEVNIRILASSERIKSSSASRPAKPEASRGSFGSSWARSVMVLQTQPPVEFWMPSVIWVHSFCLGQV